MIDAKRFIAKLIILPACMHVLVGCAFFSGKDEQQQLEDLFRTGEIALREERLRQAQENFEKLEKEHPFSIYSNYVMLALAYIHYENQQYPEAEARLDQYIRLNPDSPNLDYAYYLKGLSLYNTEVDLINLIIRRDRTDKDPKFMTASFDAFKTLIVRFPNSPYTPSARQHIMLLRNILALYEIRIADFYMRRGAYLAVINRAKYVLEQYPGAQYTPQALVLLAAGYEALGFTSLAKDSLDVLALNYPNYYKDTAIGKASAEDQKTWLEEMRKIANTTLEQLQVRPRY